MNHDHFTILEQVVVRDCIRTCLCMYTQSIYTISIIPKIVEK